MDTDGGTDGGTDVVGGGTWRAACVVVAAAGVGLACLLLGPGPVVALGLLATFLAGAMSLLLREASAGSEVRTPAAWRALLARSVELGGGFVGVCGYAALSPALSFGLVVMAAATAPPLWSRVRRAMRAARPAVPAALEPEPTWDSVSARALSTEELCLTWRRTFLLLQQDLDVAAAAAVVATRQACLDEIERRHPAGVQAWLASGARAAGSPEKFLEPSVGEGQSEVA